MKQLVTNCMEEDNWCRQADEVEALTAIYGNDWCVEDAVERRFSINIGDGSSVHHNHIQLQVTFSEDYPSNAPPFYILHAPWLRGEDRVKLDRRMQETIAENVGECLVFKFIDVVREFLDSESSTSSRSSPHHADVTERRLSAGEAATAAVSDDSDRDEVHVSLNDVDDDDDEYGFDPTLHVWHPPEDPVGSEEKPDDISLPEIFHGEKLIDRKSVFQGHLAAVTHRQQVDMVLDKLKEDRKIAAATHNIIAYRIESGRSGSFISGCADDGEIHAGSRMLHLLDIMDARNVLVIVTRWYGGVHLGPDRFKHINNCTRNMLDAHGYIRDKSDKKGPKSSTAQQGKKKKR